MLSYPRVQILQIMRREASLYQSSTAVPLSYSDVFCNTKQNPYYFVIDELYLYLKSHTFTALTY